MQRPCISRKEEERRRDSLAAGAMSLTTSSSMPTLRGSREDEKNRDSQRDKDWNLLKLRSTNVFAFDAFHSVGARANASSSGPFSGAATPSSVSSSGVGAPTNFGRSRHQWCVSGPFLVHYTDKRARWFWRWIPHAIWC